MTGDYNPSHLSFLPSRTIHLLLPLFVPSGKVAEELSQSCEHVYVVDGTGDGIPHETNDRIYRGSKMVVQIARLSINHPPTSIDPSKLPRVRDVIIPPGPHTALLSNQQYSAVIRHVCIRRCLWHQGRKSH